MISQVLLALPLTALYGLTIVLVYFMRRKEAEDQEEEEEEGD